MKLAKPARGAPPHGAAGIFASIEGSALSRR